MKGRVFVLSDKELAAARAPASGWGDLVPIFVMPPDPFRTDELLENAHWKMKLRDYEAETDWFAMTGDHRSVAFVVAALMQNEPLVKVLMFDSKSKGYYERILEAETCTMMSRR